MKSKQKGFTVIELIVVIVILAAIYGYVANIVKMVSHINDVMTGLELARMVGIVLAPLGVVLGFC